MVMIAAVCLWLPPERAGGAEELSRQSLREQLRLRESPRPPRMLATARAKPLHSPDEKLLFTDDFTEKSAMDWKLEPGWHITQVKGQGVIKGQGRYLASLEQGQEWSEYTLRARFKLIKGGVRFHVLAGEKGRYVLGVGCNRLVLTKEGPGKRVVDLTERVAAVSYGEWHVITISVYSSTLGVKIDDRSVLSHTERKSSLTRGGIAFESLRNSEVWFDSVAVVRQSLALLMPQNQLSAAAAEFFPRVPRFRLPPPEASVSEVLPNELFLDPQREGTTLGDVDSMLAGALNGAGYTSRAYYPLKREFRDVEGFALVTRMEQIREDGTPKPVPDRWAAEVPPLEGFSLKKLIERLFSAEAGYFRIIVFLATPEHFTQGDPITREAAMDWLKKGLNKLPSFIAEKEYTPAFNTTALVYQFKKVKGASEDHVEQVDGLLSCRDHLVKAGLWEAIADD
jgi:hypothetical protein